MTTNFQPTESRRLVVLDIETVSLSPVDTKGALDALTGRIVCIGLLFDDGEGVTEQVLIDQDERRILDQLWGLLQPADIIVGHNVLGFDLPFILQRSWILQIQPSRELNLRKYYTTEVFDTMQVWTNWGSKGVKLDTLAGALGCGSKSGSGTSVGTWWSARDFATIANYCMDDVRITYRVFRRLMYLPPSVQPLGTQTPSLVISPASEGAVEQTGVA